MLSGLGFANIAIICRKIAFAAVSAAKLANIYTKP